MIESSAERMGVPRTYVPPQPPFAKGRPNSQAPATTVTLTKRARPTRSAVSRGRTSHPADHPHLRLLSGTRTSFGDQPGRAAPTNDSDARSRAATQRWCAPPPPSPAIVVVIERAEPERYERVAMRRPAKLATEADAGLAGIAEAAITLEALPHEPAPEDSSRGVSQRGPTRCRQGLPPGRRLRRCELRLVDWGSTDWRPYRPLPRLTQRGPRRTQRDSLDSD
jgi:hypothetical protein